MLQKNNTIKFDVNFKIQNLQKFMKNHFEILKILKKLKIW